MLDILAKYDQLLRFWWRYVELQMWIRQFYSLRSEVFARVNNFEINPLVKQISGSEIIHFYSGEMASFKYMTDPVAKTQKLGQDLISSIYSRSAIDSIDFVSHQKHAFLLVNFIQASNDTR